ncbi:shufflon system plasmid conjugative transfer pilus tip adhesin PilV [Burkholderia thailandensis]|uniref:shufflon system plasmid conjugative transfer pilus tip adhesin PilV n=1 Tax=Burkholderia thailandensis TaxID=57975 RepID=UPI00217DBE91|nr:shufflon system plasmid conjugative transfer pilus tip adhesin PilV [Burkholderia thailandensis]MCS6514646.1 shufflon system plasmid conjugative transfer pilus tip adhesin PilV [Burkholderia thailandensis]
MKSTSSIKRQRGAVTLVETLGVLIVASLLMPAVWGWLSDDADAKINRATADHDKQVLLAAAQYIKDNYAIALALATASTPATITVPMLQSQYPQMFATGFSAKNPYAQTVTVRAYQPAAGTLDTIIVTSGGQAISEGNMRKIAQLVGGAGGYISSPNPAVANGIYGAWGPKTIPNSPRAGHMVYSLMFQNGALVSDYLYRKVVPGHPELNQMNTAIDMGGNNVNNAATVNAQKVVAPAGDSVQIGNSYYYGDGTNSAIRQNGALYVQNATGTAAADVNAGIINAQTVVTAAGGNVKIGNSTYYGDASSSAIYQNGSLFIQHPGGAAADIAMVGNVNSTATVSGAFLQPTANVALGSGCGSNAMFGKTASGPAFCQDGVWKAVGGGMLYLSAFVLPPNSTSDLGVHMYCATADSGGLSYGGTGLNAYVGTNAYGSKMWDFLGVNYSNNGPVIFCLDQQ